MKKCTKDAFFRKAIENEKGNFKCLIFTVKL